MYCGALLHAFSTGFSLSIFYNLKNADETKEMLRVAESLLSPVFISFVFQNALT